MTYQFFLFDKKSNFGNAAGEYIFFTPSEFARNSKNIYYF